MDAKIHEHLDIEKDKKLKYFFNFYTTCPEFFKDYMSHEEYLKLFNDYNLTLPPETEEGLIIFKKGLRQIIDFINPYIEQIDKTERIQCKNIILFYSLTNISQDNLINPCILNNDKYNNMVKLINETFKCRKLNFSFLGIIPYYTNIFIYLIFNKNPNIRNLQDKFELTKLNYNLDFVYKVKYNQKDKYEKIIQNYFISFCCDFNSKDIEIYECEETSPENQQLKLDITYDSQNTNLLEWQYLFVNEIKEQIIKDKETRRIIWIYDYYGCSGKSYLANYLTGPISDFLLVHLISGPKSLYNKIYNAYINNLWTGKAIIFDLPRTYERKYNFYSCFDNLKNGILDLKYTIVDFSPVNKLIIIVFANFLPEFCKLSLDRWDIREIKNYDKTKNKELTGYEIFKIPIDKRKIELVKWDSKQIYTKWQQNNLTYKSKKK
ncbi:MAG: hypothetical protein QW478_02640 [Candidatus Micrarchaeaceae archaeon]